MDYKAEYRNILRNEQAQGMKFKWFCSKCMEDDHIIHSTIKVNWNSSSMTYDMKVCICNRRK